MVKELIILVVAILNFNISQAQTKVSEIKPPDGYSMLKYDIDSYSHWIQNLPLKNDKSILSYNGIIDSKKYNVFAVVDIPLLFKSDLEQCADFAMRFWAEYHNEKNILDKLYLFDYSGNKILYKNSKKSYSQFLKSSFAYSNSHSLKSGCTQIKEPDLKPGDMFVQNSNGGIGHVSVILNVSQGKNGKKLYLIGYSFMPAQEFHIEKSATAYGESGWFTYNGYLQFLSENLPFGDAVLRRF